MTERQDNAASTTQAPESQMGPSTDRPRLGMASFVPPIYPPLFYGSLVLGTLAMTVMTHSGLQHYVGGKNSYWLAAGLWGDPLLAHLLSLALVVGAVYIHVRPRCRLSPFFFLFLAVALPVAMLFTEYFLEVYWLKPAFLVDRPLVEGLPESKSGYGSEAFLTGWIRDKVLTASDEPGTSCPSGFVLRQLWLSMFCLVYILGAKTQRARGQPPIPLSRADWLIVVIQMILLAHVIISRVYLARHTLFDVGVAFGVGVFLFWLPYVVLSEFLAAGERSHLVDMSGAACAFLPLFWFYSQSAWQWSLAAVVVFVLLGATYYFAPGPKGDYFEGV